MGDLENLLLLDGEIFPMDNGYWVKFEAKVVEVSENIPHGVRYSLTLHDKNNHRIIGYDNAHSFKPSTFRYGARKTSLDHIHKKEETFAYEFDCAGILIEDFWKSVNYYLENHQGDPMKSKILHVGIMNKADYIKRTIAIAKGEHTPKADEPKVWFESIKSLAQVLSNENQALLKIIDEKHPQSLSELESLTGRKKSNLSRTLKTLERYGIVKLYKEKNSLVPKVQATDFRVEFGLGSSAA